MDKAMAYSVLVTWADNSNNPQRAEWCYKQMLNLLLADERETINFFRVQKDSTYLDLLSRLLPELAYQFNSRIFLRKMEEIGRVHNSQVWQKNLAIAKTKVKAPEIDEMDF